MNGVWGPVTSSVDWCERNYEHTRWVCELFNTLSSGAMITAGVLGILLQRKVLPLRFLIAFGILIGVGLGSVAFHGTLHFELQMLDELPMLYLVLLMVFILVEDQPERRHGTWFPMLLSAAAGVLTFLCTFTRGHVQFFCFQIGFGSLELFCLTRVTQLAWRSRKPGVRRLFRWGVAGYILGILVWFTDLKGCSWLDGWLPEHGIPNPQLHALWHLLVSFGFYCLLLMIAQAQAIPQARRVATSRSR